MASMERFPWIGQEIPPLITDIPRCKPRYLPFGEKVPPPHVDPTERKQSFSLSAGTLRGCSGFSRSSILHRYLSPSSSSEQVTWI
ncbi:hypothetical protein EYF80_015146 [Liparis tanakae]|uniref:Uncharacterized protein n=1 Tax=Liparis tanakae TaxID=230148 RepID=A0A4Z2I948_9TELE|nr:hypothetical protein EYF80_015146 [Liparis tanakae]